MGAKASQITDFRRAGGAAAAVTVVGGTLVLGGSPANALTIVVDSVADDGAGSLRRGGRPGERLPGS